MTLSFSPLPLAIPLAFVLLMAGFGLLESVVGQPAVAERLLEGPFVLLGPGWIALGLTILGQAVR